MTLSYPRSFSQIRSWSTENGVSVNEGRTRFAQYGILRGVANSRALSRLLVFKGGNALDFVWEPNRSTQDLDFSADMSALDADWDLAKVGEFLRTSLEPGLRVVTAELGIGFAIYKVERQPRGEDKTFVTYTIHVGYGFPDQLSVLQRMSQGIVVAQKIPVEVSLNEPICAVEEINIQATNILRVSTLEDIVAEKLRSLLQQRVRNRNRRQDLLDIAVILGDNPELDRSRIAEFLQLKSQERDVIVLRSAFHHPEIAERAAHEYEALAKTTRRTFVPFDEALARLLGFVDTLPIPE